MPKLLPFPISSDQMEEYQKKKAAGQYSFTGGKWYETAAASGTPAETVPFPTQQEIEAKPKVSPMPTPAPVAPGFDPATYAQQAGYSKYYQKDGQWYGNVEGKWQIFASKEEARQANIGASTPAPTPTPTPTPVEPPTPTTEPPGAPEGEIPSDQEQSLMDKYGWSIEEARDPNAIKGKIDELTAQISEATTDLERETAIQDMVELAASLGLPYPEKYVEAMTGPVGKTEEEIKTELYDKYGIEDLEDKFDDRPEQTFEEIYESAYETSGLGDLKTEMNDLRKKIADAEENRDEALADINENPWLPEASRVGRAKRVQDMAQRELDRLVNQLTLADTMYARGKEEAESVATRALQTFQREREWTKEELNYYIQRADADLEAKLAIQATEAEKERFRYYPEYLKGFKPEEDLLSVSEAKALGVPYGTTKAQAAAMGKVPTGAEKKSFLSNEDYKSLTAIGVPKVVADAIMIALNEGQDLEPIRLGLAEIYGKDKGYRYLDLFMPYIQERYGKAE